MMDLDTAALESLWFAGYTQMEIAQRLGCSDDTVRKAADRLKLPRRPRQSRWSRGMTLMELKSMEARMRRP